MLKYLPKDYRRVLIWVVATNGCQFSRVDLISKNLVNKRLNSEKQPSFLFLGGHPLPDTIMTPTLFSLSNSKNFSLVGCLRDTILSSSFFWRHDASDMQEKLCIFAKIWSFQFGKLTGISLKSVMFLCWTMST